MEEKSMFENWLEAVAQCGDPMKRPNILAEAFAAGYVAGSGEIPDVIVIEDHLH